MPQRYNEEIKNTFVQGLITERSELTFPENASSDELNCDLLRTGARRKRLGLVQETGGVFTTETIGDSTVVSVHQWENVGEVEDTTFTVVQTGATLMFFEQDGTALSGNRVPVSSVDSTAYSLDLTTYQRPASGADASAARIQVASIKGGLIVASSEINTIQITRTGANDSFEVSEIVFRERDFRWLGDTSAYDDGPAELVFGWFSAWPVRYYDTKNAGWADGPDDVGDDALDTYSTAKGGSGTTQYMPPLTHSWFSGKNSSDVFSVAEWEKVYSGSTLITNGHYILDLYSKDRETASGLTTIVSSGYNSTEDARFSTLAAYAGRMFYSGMNESTDDNGSKIFFSQILERGFTKVGELFQQNDPTGEVTNDLLDTDGGFVEIPEAHNILQLHTFGPDLYVFASNGVWRISGVDDVFRATEYSVSKISEDGILSAESFISASGRPYWWATSGIYTLGVDNQSGTLVAQNISLSTVQTFWDNIEDKDTVTGVFDEDNRRVIWAYSSVGETVANKLNEFLIFDEVLGAFFPWKVSDEGAATDYIVGLVSPRNTTDSVRYLYRDEATDGLSFAEFSSIDFLDWGSADYSSYVETAYNYIGSGMLKKNAPYILTMMGLTEEGWEVNGAGYDPIRTSSLLVSGHWDFRSSTTSTAQECYRYKYTPVVDTGDLTNFGYPESVISSRLKVRGRGRSLVLRWEGQTGKDFHLLGWTMLGASNDRV